MVTMPYLSDTGDVCIVPGIIVNENSPIGHGRDLVAIIPPGHDLGIFCRILSQPVIGL